MYINLCSKPPQNPYGDFIDFGLQSTRCTANDNSRVEVMKECFLTKTNKKLCGGIHALSHIHISK